MDLAESARKQLLYGLGEIFTPEIYPQFLSFSSRFLSFSWQNVVLMYMQDPDARCVAGAAAWKAASGFSVLPDAQPILVLYPQYDPAAASFSWSIRKVFDLRRLPMPAKKEGGPTNNASCKAKRMSTPGTPPGQPAFTPSQAYFVFKNAFRRETGMSVYPSDGPAKGLEIAGRAVLIPKDADDRQKVILLLDHILASNTLQGELPIVKGCIDNSIRYILYSLYGFEDAERIVFPYISLPVLDEDKRAQILKRVFQISGRLART